MVKKKKAKTLMQKLAKPIKSRKILKSERATLTIKERKQEPYISTFFKEEFIK